jgi:hypothetical protein
LAILLLYSRHAPTSSRISGEAITRSATKRKKGASRLFLVAPMVAGACNAPNALSIPFSYHLDVSQATECRSG